MEEATAPISSYPKGNASFHELKDKPTRKVPVVSWASAGAGGNFSDLEEQIDEYLETDCKDPNAYALIIEGDSMEPRFLAGDRVIFMPNSAPQNGNVVVARLKKDGQVLLKVYHTFGPHAEMVRLTSFNHRVYPPLEYHAGDFRFIHPVHSTVRRERR